MTVAFEELPRRLYLDSSTLQTLDRYGEFVWENVEPPDDDRCWQTPQLLEDLQALRLIFRINERAMFDIVVTRAALEEVAAKKDGAYLRWVRDVAAHWQDSLDEQGDGAFDGSGRELILAEPRFGYLSRKDKRLLQDAIAVECSAFVTMEKRLPKTARHFEAATGLKLLRPPELATMLGPWAALYL